MSASASSARDWHWLGAARITQNTVNFGGSRLTAAWDYFAPELLIQNKFRCRAWIPEPGLRQSELDL